MASWVEKGGRVSQPYWALQEDGAELAIIRKQGDRYFFHVLGARVCRQTGSKNLDSVKRDAETIVEFQGVLQKKAALQAEGPGGK